MLEKYCVYEDYTIKEVLNQFESNNDRVAIVITKSKKVIGVVSQGDILRALSAGVDLYVEIRQIIRSSFLHLYSRNMEDAYAIFKKRKISLLPIIGYENELTGVITLDDIFSYLEEKKDNIQL